LSIEKRKKESKFFCDTIQEERKGTDSQTISELLGIEKGKLCLCSHLDGRRKGRGLKALKSGSRRGRERRVAPPGQRRKRRTSPTENGLAKDVRGKEEGLAGFRGESLGTTMLG